MFIFQQFTLMWKAKLCCYEILVPFNWKRTLISNKFSKFWGLLWTIGALCPLTWLSFFWERSQLQERFIFFLTCSWKTMRDAPSTWTRQPTEQWHGNEGTPSSSEINLPPTLKSFSGDIAAEGNRCTAITTRAGSFFLPLTPRRASSINQYLRRWSQVFDCKSWQQFEVTTRSFSTLGRHRPPGKRAPVLKVRCAKMVTWSFLESDLVMRGYVYFEWNWVTCKARRSSTDKLTLDRGLLRLLFWPLIDMFK